MENVVERMVEFPFIPENGQESLVDQDSTFLRRIFPNEIWQLVTNRLEKRPDDLINLKNSSPYFRNLLSKNLTLSLFEKVFSVVVPTVWENDGEDEVEGSLPFSDMLKCREVCSLWNGVVDTVFKRKFDRNELPALLDDLLSYKTITHFDSRYNDICEFLVKVEDTHNKSNNSRNPFIWPDLKIRLESNDGEISPGNLSFVREVSLVLELYGHHIMRCDILITSGSLHLETALRILDWINHMPNIRKLTINNETPKLEDNFTLQDFQSVLENHCRFQDIIKLVHLEYLKCLQVPSIIFAYLIMENNHISSLKLTDCDANYSFFHCDLPNLKSFKLDIISVDWFEKLSKPSNVKWPLVENLSISVQNCFVDFYAILETIQTKFGNNKLERLRIELPEARNCNEANRMLKDSLSCRLKLKSLNDVSLILRDYISLDFLLPMKDTLKSMKFEIFYDVKPRLEFVLKSSTVHFTGFEDSVFDYNIPTIFTNLERFGFVREEDDKVEWEYL